MTLGMAELSFEGIGGLAVSEGRQQEFRGQTPFGGCLSIGRHLPQKGMFRAAVDSINRQPLTGLTSPLYPRTASAGAG